jgi:hypothetical protein
MNRIGHNSAMQRIQATANEFQASAKGLSGVDKTTNSIGTKIMEMFDNVAKFFKGVLYSVSGEAKADIKELVNLETKIGAQRSDLTAATRAYNKTTKKLTTEIKGRSVVQLFTHNRSDNRRTKMIGKTADQLTAKKREIETLEKQATALAEYIQNRMAGIFPTQTNDSG